MKRKLLWVLCALGWCGLGGAAATGAESARSAPCEYEANCECGVPGITARWKAAYCMSVEQTDDLEQGAVQRCLNAPDPAKVAHLGRCGQNAYWKARLCRSLHREAEQARRCARDGSFIPAFVRTGEGGGEPR